MKLLLRSLPLLLLAACSAPKASPPPNTASSGASEPRPGAGPAAPAPVLPAGVGGTSDGAGPRATSPVSDPSSGDGSTSAGPSTRRVEDIKIETTTATGGSYLVAVRSATGLVADEVGKAINAAASKTDGCYAKAIKKKLPPGAILYDVSIDAKGGASGVKLVSDAIKDGELTKCLETSLKSITWPKPSEKAGGKTTIEFATTK